MEAYRYYRHRQALLGEMSSTLKAEPEKLPDRLNRTIERMKELEAEMRRRDREEVGSLIEHGIEWRETEAAGAKIVTAAVGDFNPDDLRELAERTLNSRGAQVVAIGTAKDGKASVVVALSKETVKAGLNAVDLIRRAGKLLEGGGGGRPDMAVGGGSRVDRIEAGLELIAGEARSQLEKANA
jgi:alanyl-tRNA synthetase